jgi:hypothetical protein
MPAQLWWAHLYPQSPRYATWRAILGSDNVPLKSPRSAKASLGFPVCETVECYEIDLAAMTAEQKDRLFDWCAGQFGEDRAAIRADLEREGFPIREADVIVAFSLRAFV